MPSPADAGPPDYIGVGAAGSGTAWWHRRLVAHPEIRSAGGGRGLRFFTGFCARELEDADIARYHGHFPRVEGTIAGEWTARYMLDAWAPPLLRRAAPEAKLLVMLSDPIERYRAIFAERLRAPRATDVVFMADVVDRRCHAAQLRRLHRFFPPERILVLQYERAVRDPVAEYRRTLEFLGVRDAGFVPRRLTAAAAGTREPRRLALAARLPVPEATKRRLAERLSGGRPVQGRLPPLWPDVEAALHTALDPDVAALPELVPHLDLSLWPNFAHLAAAAPARA